MESGNKREKQAPSNRFTSPLRVWPGRHTETPVTPTRRPPADNLRGTNIRRIASDEPLICHFAIICLLMSIFAPDFVRLI